MSTLTEFTEQDINIAKQLPSCCEAGKSYGVSHIQRSLRVGYNRACGILELALAEGYVERDSQKEWLFKLPLNN